MNKLWMLFFPVMAHTVLANQVFSYCPEHFQADSSEFVRHYRAALPKTDKLIVVTDTACLYGASHPLRIDLITKAYHAFLASGYSEDQLLTFSTQIANLSEHHAVNLSRYFALSNSNQLVLRSLLSFSLHQRLREDTQMVELNAYEKQELELVLQLFSTND